MLCSSNSSSLIKIARLKILLKMYCCRKLRIMVYYTQFLNLQAKRFFPIKLKRNMAQGGYLSTVTHHIPIIKYYSCLK